ncbi:unnamed protein product [Sphenostylis stenocarpa]|uniref:Pullulanase 1, chloroplastic n=1 Tax=Sphenostylis stenocarpa TaxID=92480 RepID=A0AA86W1C3_9FABA|nr:unnamed protein product [Sphenostylis stenocarpa]
MLLLASSSSSSPSLTLPSLSHFHHPLLSSFHRPSLHLHFPSQATPLRLHTPPSLPCSLNSSSSVEQSASFSQNSLLFSRAYWVTESLIAWNEDVANGFSCCLIASKNASLTIANCQIQGEDLKIELEEDRAGLPANVIYPFVPDILSIFLNAKVVEKFPHIRGYKAYKLPATFDVKPLLKSQLAVAIYDSEYKCRNCTGLQLPGVLDELFSYNGPLGAHFSEEAVSLYLISSDGKRTFLLNIGSDELKPDGWDNLANEKPTLQSFTDISIYEMHIRDFSATDLSVQPEIRGGYLAFTLQLLGHSSGSCKLSYQLSNTLSQIPCVLHLKRLSSAGITHVHLLPTFQFAEVDDQKENWSLPPDSDQQQALITAIQNFDGYNWGYNPVLWGVPKGSYASNPNGPYRTIEFRKMVKALNHIGLRVVLDVVYNHLQGSGPFEEYSVLDKIVPGYFLRRNSDGFIENSTCINNTAGEHFMAERMILDDLVHWAVNYKIDGFRFDLMGHIMKSTMVKAKTALHCLTKEKDGVDGSSIYMYLFPIIGFYELESYGEGWDFGEVAKNGRGINASQFNLPGTQIGSFNDRIRDAILGGSPFGNPLQQGFVTGLLLQPNGHDHGTEENAKSMLAASMDHIQIGMAANLQDYLLTNCEGEEICGCGGDMCNERDGNALMTMVTAATKVSNQMPAGVMMIESLEMVLVVKGSEILTYDGAPVAYASVTMICVVAALMTMVTAATKVSNQMPAGVMMIESLEMVLVVKGSEILTYDGAPVAYASCPIETINYVSAHDNETLFDIVSLKTPMDITVAERCRINHLATSIIALSQDSIELNIYEDTKGIPFFHSGDEILRSKSLDRDSYNSGDWFNRLDFTYNSNNWGVGLPPREKNERNWPLIKPRLANPSFRPQKIDILATLDNFLNLLRIRYSSPLFRLKTADAIQQRVSFHNTGPSWVCGVIVMSIEDGNDGFPGLSQLDPIYSFIVVVVNASPKEVSFVSPTLHSRSLQLHPIQFGELVNFNVRENLAETQFLDKFQVAFLGVHNLVSSSDDLVKSSRYEASSGCFVVPHRTTAVFVEPRKT